MKILNLLELQKFKNQIMDQNRQYTLIEKIPPPLMTFLGFGTPLILTYYGLSKIGFPEKWDDLLTIGGTLLINFTPVLKKPYKSIALASGIYGLGIGASMTEIMRN